jgi:carbon-monoxide dehydrogenase large subunit
MVGSILGTRVLRVEDPDLLTGKGTYIGNLRVPGLTHAAFVRSPVAHARIGSIDVSEARRAPGVVAVLTAADLGIEPFHGFMVLNAHCARPPLATDKVRFVGEPVALVVADTAAAAEDATELVVVDYDPLPAVVDPEAALAPDAPLQFEEMGTNLAAGSRDDADPDPLAGATQVVRVRIENQRVAVVPMEGNAIAAIPGDDSAGHDLTVYVSTQMPHGFHATLCRLLGLEPAAVRVVTPHVGGGFGAKAGVAAEHLVITAAARRLGVPVSWIETRSENLVAMPHGRGQVDYVELGFDDEARITGMRLRVVSDAGAYAGFGGALAIGPTRLMAQGVYRIPVIHYDVAAALTNTTPMGAFRGAGRPEAAELLERTLDLAADELDIDPVELRRRNLLAADSFPLTSVMGAAYDSGNYQAALEEALRVAGYDELRAEQVEADRLGIPVESVHFIQSDTAEVPRGGGTGGSRSLQIGGNAVRQATEEVWDAARELAAAELEASVEDIVVTDDGRVGVAGVPARALTWGRLAQLASAGGGQLQAAVDFVQSGATFPFGAHVSVVEVDLDTGLARPLRHIAVDDCGRILSPLIVTGQQHGGIAQGMAQALWEQMVYDAEGNPLTANLADYAMPSAAELPSFEASNTETPSPLNPLGAKGIGESGTIGSTPAVHNAVIDALSHLGVRHIDMPCTPMKVWQAITAAEAGTLPPVWREPPAALADLPLKSRSARPEAADVDI